MDTSNSWRDAVSEHHREQRDVAVEGDQRSMHSAADQAGDT
jgi:hypothetical protein